MNELMITNVDGIETIDSRLIAESIGKDHAHLMRDIAKYCEYLGESKIGLSDFFIESTYTTSQNKKMPCYLCTRKGCEMIANKMTGAKGTVFTAQYINAFHDMEQHIKNGADSKHIKTAAEKQQELEIRLMNARVRMSNQLLKLTKVETLSEQYKNVLVAKSAEVLTGEKLLPLPKSEKTYSASDIAEILGVSSQKIGRIAKEHNLKVKEYGEWYRDKSPYSNKEVDTFRYNDKAIEKFKEFLS